MEGIEKNLSVSEQMLINFMETDDRESARNFSKEILASVKDNDTAIFFEAYVEAIEDEEKYEYFFEKYEETFNLLEKKDIEEEEKCEKIKRYLTFASKFLKSISKKPVEPSNSVIFGFIYTHINMIIEKKSVLGEDLKNFLCREVMASLKKIIDPICRMHAKDLHNVIRCCYLYGDIEKKTNAIINNIDHITEEEAEAKIGGKILEIQKEIDKIKPEYDTIMEKGNFFVKILPKTRELAQKIMEQVVKQRNLVEEYMEEVRVPCYFRINELWQYHETAIEEVQDRHEKKLIEKVEAFSEKYKVENHFYYYFLVKYEKLKLKNKKEYKKYDPTLKGNFFEI